MSELVAQYLQDADHAALAVRGETPQRRTSDRDRIRTEGERLGHVGPAPDPTVEEHGNPPVDSLDDPRQLLDRRGRGVELAPAVVGDDERIDAAVDGQPGVLGMQDALDAGSAGR